MSCTLIRSSAAQLEAISNDPDILEDMIDLADAPCIDGTDLKRTDMALDLGRSFAGLNYLLNDRALFGHTPLSFMYGGQPLTEEEYGLAPPLGHRPEVVQDIDAALKGIDQQWLTVRYDARQLDEDQIYPRDWSDDQAQRLGWLIASLQACQSFIADAAAAQQGLIVIHS